jgi:hypothetical protein
MSLGPPATAINQPVGLSPKEVIRFHSEGFLGPFQAYSVADMVQMRSEIEKILESDPPDHSQRHHNRHLDKRLIWDVARNREIATRMTSVLGEDILLWRTNFFVKNPGAKAIPWHQDYNFWPLEPTIAVSAWIAIDAATRENACPQVIPGSHRKRYQHVKMSDVEFDEGADVDDIDVSRAVPLEMKPGEFFLFNERTLHYSPPNTSQKRRIGLAIRAIVPFVRVTRRDSPNHGVMQISGVDKMGFNRHREPPTT